ncbi:isochorismatase family cysteine hydrolase [Heyndrickxia vini]|nr:isochorismatase family cysteine hydrolase [Heyndrickxia vini]
MSKDHTLHGNTLKKATTALLMIDVINGMNFDGGKDLLKNALPMAKRLSTLKREIKKKNIPVIYINDNYGKWNSDREQIINEALKEGSIGNQVTDLLKPDEDDYFIIKPKHSGFFSTTLEVLLASLKVKQLILTGVQTDICVFFTANDAFMRNYQLYIPEDCVASESIDDHHYTLKKMEELLHVDTTPSTNLDLDQILDNENMSEAN